MEDKIFKVSEFNEFINIYLNQVGETVIEGEISTINISGGKWIFITIKDENSSLEIFGMTYKIYNYKLLEPGMMVHIYGTPRLYKKSGKFSVMANKILPAGEGALRVAFEKLKLKLQSEGLFDRKRPIPLFPEKIGLITAAGSRAYSDYIKVLKERMGGLKIYFFPVNVQGAGSAEGIMQAFKYFNTRADIDLLILTRGGGSLEDMQTFNDERVARAIFSSRIPVITGVGHEEDISIADFVSDLRASTPSNAAELTVKSRSEVITDINYKIKIIENTLKQKLEKDKQKVLRSMIFISGIISTRIKLFESLLHRFNLIFVDFTKENRIYIQKISNLQKGLVKFQDYWFKQKKQNLLSLIRLLESLDYNRVLERGYSITTLENGKIIKSIDKLNFNETIITSLYHGKIRSAIKKINE